MNGLYTDGSNCRTCEEWVFGCLTCSQKSSTVKCVQCADDRELNFAGDRCNPKTSDSDSLYLIIGIVGAVVLVVGVGKSQFTQVSASSATAGGATAGTSSS